MTDNVNHPAHYESASGVECIEVASALPYALGNAVKYVWRAPHKGHYREDMLKAQWFLHQYIDEWQSADARTPVNDLVLCDLNFERAFSGMTDDPAMAWQQKIDIVIQWLHGRHDDRERFFRALRELNVDSMAHAVDLIIYFNNNVSINNSSK